MLSKKMMALLNEQITHEFYSSLLYLQMGAWFGEQSLSVFQRYFNHHAQEEHMHATKLVSYVLNAGGHVQIGAMPAMPHEYSSALDVTEKTLEHERFVTDKIHALMALAEEEKDYPTRGFLQWYVDEQVEEMAIFSELVAVTRMAGNNLLGLEQRVEKLLDLKMAAEVASDAATDAP